jgi:GDP-L-fucose synthase
MDLRISEIAHEIAKSTGFTGKTIWDVSKPDGTPQKLLDVSKIQSLGWVAKTPLAKGILETISWAEKDKIF